MNNGRSILKEGKINTISRIQGISLQRRMLFRMQMQLITLAEVATFQQGNRYILIALLSTINAIERSMVNWAKWLKV
jgi:hypothetical protein